MFENGHIVAEAFVPPTIEDLELPSIFSIGSFGFTKQMLLMLLSVVLISAFFLIAGRKRALVPSRAQFVAESGYLLTRNSLGRELIGAHHFKPFVPLLFTCFFLTLVNNLYGSIPVLQLPTFSHAGSAYVIAAFAYLTWVIVGISRKGFGGFFKDLLIIPGVPTPLHFVLVPIEFMSNLLIRPVTHALRLFATMFGGHMAMTVVAAMTAYLIESVGGLGAITAVASSALGVFLFFLELLVQALQAYIFTLLLAVYLQGSVSEGH